MMTESEQYRRRSRWLMQATTVVMVAIVLVAALYVYVVMRAQLDDPEVLLRLALAWLPSVFYLWALWILRGLFAALAGDGLRLQPGVAKAMARIGMTLMAGGATTLLTVPLISMLAQPHKMGSFPLFNVPALVLMMLGLALLVLARLLQQGVALQAEAGKLRDALDGFI
jgi:hypothetical protein